MLLEQYLNTDRLKFHDTVATARIDSNNIIRIHRKTDKKSDQVYWRYVRSWRNPKQRSSGQQQASWVSSEVLLVALRQFSETTQLDVCMEIEDQVQLIEDLKSNKKVISVGR